MNEGKVWWKSKTIWFNVLMAILPIVIQNAHLLKAFLPANIMGLLLFTAVIGNAILRFITSKPVTAK